jgi:hypothetical protein
MTTTCWEFQAVVEIAEMLAMLAMLEIRAIRAIRAKSGYPLATIASILPHPGGVRLRIEGPTLSQ